MGKTIIYVIESGLCLSIFFLIYHLLFRKETYFGFIRWYLTGALVLSIIIPVANYNASAGGRLIKLNQQKVKYENRLIKLNVELGDDEITELNHMTVIAPQNKNGDYKNSSNKRAIYTHTIRYSYIALLALYLAGCILMFSRFLFNLVRIWQLYSKNKKYKDGNYTVVDIKRPVLPFSFFNVIFINESEDKNEQSASIYLHEKIHCQRRHSFDILLMQLVLTLQWFNPFAWKIQKAIKSNHEFQVDHQILKQGIPLYDYQELLLNQLLQFKSIPLVHNFNLLSIKKRILMMTKNKSGQLARLKPLLAIPAFMALVLIFADCNQLQPQNDSKSEPGYLKTTSTESILESDLHGIELPVIPNQIVFKPIHQSIHLVISKDILCINKKKIKMHNLEKEINSAFANEAEEVRKRMTVKLYADVNVSMEKITLILETLRKCNALKIAYMGKANDTDMISENNGIAWKLPPMDAEEIELSELDKQGIPYKTIEVDKDFESNRAITQEINSWLTPGEMQLISTIYSNTTLYGTYVDIILRTRNAYAIARNQLSQEMYQTNFDKLDNAKQKEIRKQIPMRITQKNDDW
ncbi:MAG: M56 family metallopeptidase [Bacteroidales bacterium]|nr:M56 family metallopeptidase [Bacteroidales bacterium]